MDVNKITNTFQDKSSKVRLDSKMESILNEQIAREFEASQIYLGMSTWCEYTGYSGTAKYLAGHVDEEREHMMKIYSYMLDKNIMPKTPAVKDTTCSYKDLIDVLKKALEHEIGVTESYNKALIAARDSKDEMTYEFLQWFINEQLDEEGSYLNLLDRIEVIGNDKRGQYFLDKEIDKLV